MFIRRTKTSNAASGEAYTTFRLVASERIDGKVRQRTLLNLGSAFSLELVRPRSIGVEHVGKAALEWLDFSNPHSAPPLPRLRI